jgi:hypothetical protein
MYTKMEKTQCFLLTMFLKKGTRKIVLVNNGYEDDLTSTVENLVCT